MIGLGSDKKLRHYCIYGPSCAACGLGISLWKFWGFRFNKRSFYHVTPSIYYYYDKFLWVWAMMGWNYKTHYCRHKRTSRRERLWKTSDYTHCFKSLVALHRFDWVCQIISLNYQIVRTKGLSWWSLKSNNFIVLLIEGFQLQSKLIYVYRRSPSQIIVKWSPSIFIATLLISMITSFLRS